MASLKNEWIRRGDDVVFIVALPSSLTRELQPWNDLGYVEWSLLSWRAWCAKNGISLFVMREPTDDLLEPTEQRYNAYRVLEDAGVPCRRLALVDADTMVRWDTPDFFSEIRGQLNAVIDNGHIWIHRSIRAYSELFPYLTIRYYDYFNCGFLVFSEDASATIHGWYEFFRENGARLREIRAKHPSVGTDQTVVNYLARRDGLRVHLLDQRFNQQSCISVPREWRADFVANRASAAEIANRLIADPGTFDFAEMSYVWHFNSLPPPVRSDVMKATWNRFRDRYFADERK
jgi:hypothetical protein